VEVPLWIPLSGPDDVNRYFMGISVEKAVAAGLKFRPLSETVRDTLEWDLSRPADATRRAGLAREKEREVLDAWRGRGGT
jgi:2'-hydroxyisoflavone reductase